MEIYWKTVVGGLIAMILSLSLAKQGKDFGLLLVILSCGMILIVSIRFLEPVIEFFNSLEDLIPLNNALLETMLKITGIGLVGEIAAMICADSGNSALGKSLQIFTSILILWLSLPLFQSLLTLVRGILEAL